MAQRIGRFQAVLLILISFALLACASTPADLPEPEAPMPSTAPPPVQSLSLTGTAWQLVEIQSMNDEAFQPLAVEIYTLGFADDGTLSIRADCNRGSASYEQTGSSLEIGEIALTRAMCRPQSLHNRFIRDLREVRSFVIEAGHLYLATRADGAILEFEPAP